MAKQSFFETPPCRPALSVVVPVFNAGALVRALYERLQPVAIQVTSAYEIIMVDDGSVDDTFQHLHALHRIDPLVKIIRLARNFGHQTAISAGLAKAAGDFVALMDGDLQDPPELLPTLLETLEKGYDVAYVIRTDRPESWLKRTAYFLFYRILHAIARVQIPLDAGDFCMMNRRVVLAINGMPERNRFIRGLRHWVGFKQVGVPCVRHARAGGVAKYTWGKLIRLCFDGIVSFSDLPLRLGSYLGFIVSSGSFIGIGIVLYFRLFTNRSIPGFASLAILILFLGGMQLLTIGVLGEYLGRTLDEARQRPLYIISHLVGWPSEFVLEQQSLSGSASLEPTP